jgi:hypothetical protein
MVFEGITPRLGLNRAWARELVWAVIALGLGFGLMPLLIFAAGSMTLGRYEGAAASKLYSSVFAGLSTGSAASWVVVLGPYGLYLLFKVLLNAWRAGSRPG